MKRLSVVILILCASVGWAQTQYQRSVSSADFQNVAKDTLGWFNVKAYGAAGDGVTLDSVALASAIAAASAAGGGTVYLPYGTYLTGSHWLHGAAYNNVYFYSNNATLKATADSAKNTYTLKWDTVAHSGVFGKLTFDGNRANKKYKAGDGHTPVYIRSSNDLFFSDIVVSSAAGDGIYIGGAGAAVYNVTFQRVQVDSAYRNGISITNAYNVSFGDVEIKNTTGTAPQSGIDIEPNSASDSLKDITFGMLCAHGNVGSGIYIQGFDTTGVKGVGTKHRGAHYGVSIRQINSYSNTVSGLYLDRAFGVSVLSGNIYSNTANGVYVARDTRDVKIQANIFQNGEEGIKMYLTSQNFISKNFDYSGCRIFDNSAISANKSGIQLHSDDVATYPIQNVNLSNAQMFNSPSLGTQQTFVASIDSNMAMKREVNTMGMRTWNLKWSSGDQNFTFSDINGNMHLQRPQAVPSAAPATGYIFYVVSGGANADTLRVMDQKGNVTQIAP